MVKIMRTEKASISEKPTERNVPKPIVPAMHNFLTARKMAQENLEHQPLPDAIMDLAFRKMQAHGEANPGLFLDVVPISTGCKNYYIGPTKCTKLRVYRPKTCGVVPPVVLDTPQRPTTAYLIKEKMGAMDLAIGWDILPKDPRDEPKPPKHIDGSNGSVAPALFSVVVANTPSKLLPNKIEHTEGIFSNTMGAVDFFDRDIKRQQQEFGKKQGSERKCDCKEKLKQESILNDFKLPKPNTSPMKCLNEEPFALGDINNNSADMTKSSKEVDPLGFHLHEKHYCTKTNQKVFCPKHKNGHRLYYSMEDLYKQIEKQNSNPLTQKQKTQRLCQRENVSYLKEISKEDYKAAFKAGIPKSNSSSDSSGVDCSSNSNSISSCIKTALKVPKPKSPFAKKNYSISTLNPPFSCFKGGDGQGAYADHWRLASVYQHAYKPIEKRKRSLLQTVFQ